MSGKAGIHRIDNPRGSIIVTKSGTARLKWSADFGRNWSGKFNTAQAWLDNEVLRRCDRKVPMRTGMLKKSGQLGTVIGSGVVQYIAVYAKKQYYENKGRGERGRLWFERMKAESKAALLRGVQALMKQNGGSA